MFKDSLPSDLWEFREQAGIRETKRVQEQWKHMTKKASPSLSRALWELARAVVMQQRQSVPSQIPGNERSISQVGRKDHIGRGGVLSSSGF